MKKMKDVIETAAFVKLLDAECQTYKKMTGKLPTDDRKIELLWPVMDAGTTIEASRKSLDVEGCYKTLCLEIRERLLLLHPTQVLHSRGKPDVVMGVSAVEGAEQAAAPATPAQQHLEPAL